MFSVGLSSDFDFQNIAANDFNDFDLSKISKNLPKLDIQKIDYFQKNSLRSMTNSDLNDEFPELRELKMTNIEWDLIKNNVTWTDLNSTINTWNFQEDRDGMYINQLNHFFDCTESDGKPKVTIEDGISIQKLIDSIQAGNIRSSI